MGVSLWPGYTAKMQQIDAGLFLQIKPQYEVIRTEQTVLQELNVIKEVNENRGVDYRIEIREYMIGQTVVTRYNNRTYKIDDVEFTMNPDSKFSVDE